MSDLRIRKVSNHAPFRIKDESEKAMRLFRLLELAESLKMQGFEDIDFNKSEWVITSGRLLHQKGKNTKSVTLKFVFPSEFGGHSLTRVWYGWTWVCKSLMLLRFHRHHQAVPNQRNFIKAVGYVSYAANQLGQDLFSLTPEALNNACDLISQHSGSAGTAYNLHKAVMEFAGHCDANELCNCRFEFRYSKLKRPESTGGLSQLRLDDPAVTETHDPKMVEPKVFMVIGQLYQNVPKDHPHRTYILILTLLCCLGRRLSEILLLPIQEIKKGENGQYSILYFPRKSSAGENLTPKRELFLPTAVVSIVKDVFAELNTGCAAARSTAAEQYKNKDIDSRFLNDIPDEGKLRKADLKRLGVSPSILDSKSWFAKSGLVLRDELSLKSSYTTKKNLFIYCRKSSIEHWKSPLEIDQFNQPLYLHNFLIVRYVGLSTGAYSCWSASQCTHSMVTTFLRNFSTLSKQYASVSVDVDFTSHSFRHTLNTLMDEGGLSDLLQTEWFGRSNPKDTKMYQHTSPTKRALLFREDLKALRVGGRIADQLRLVPLNKQEGFLRTRISAVHDVGPGLCIHNFAQTPCERHLQCTAHCEDYVWIKSDLGRLDEVKRQYAMAYQTQKLADEVAASDRPRKSVDWKNHTAKKLQTLSQQLIDGGVIDFDPEMYLKESSDE